MMCACSTPLVWQLVETAKDELGTLTAIAAAAVRMILFNTCTWSCPVSAQLSHCAVWPLAVDVLLCGSICIKCPAVIWQLYIHNLAIGFNICCLACR